MTALAALALALTLLACAFFVLAGTQFFVAILDGWIGGLGSRLRGRASTADDRERGENGGLTYLKHEGQEVWSRMDETLLQEMALKTGGAYIPALSDYSVIVRGTVAAREGQQMQWVPACDLRDYPMPPADAELTPWLLRFFDQIRFYPVATEELAQMRENFIHGRFSLRIEDSVLKLRDYNRFLEDNSDAINAFKRRQQAAFEAERERWEQAGQAQYTADLPDETSSSDAPFDVPHGCIAVASPVSGSVWGVPVNGGDRVAIGDALIRDYAEVDTGE